MTGNGTSLRETLKDVVGETIGNSATSKSETESNTPKSQEVDTNSGETTSIEMSGIKVDLSDIPEQDRPRIKKHLEDKLKLVDSGATKKFQELSKKEKEVETFRSALKEVTDLGYTTEQALEVLKKGKQIPNSVNKEIKGFERKIKEIETSNLDYSQKQEAIRNLQEARELLLEETGVGELRKENEEMKKTLNLLLGSHTISRRTAIENELVQLKKDYGKDLVEKYQDVIMDEALKYNVEPTKVLFFRAEPKEIEQAISSKGQRTKEKINAITSTGSGVTSSAEKVNTKQKWGPFLRDIIATQKK